ncbi:MAG: leucine--tRNA ligase [Methanomicrobiales archaeon]|nr:leucine--tRNA ligase [Methanomicrobiales archaeon]
MKEKEGSETRRQEEEIGEEWAGEFEVDPSPREKLYINVAFPYPSGAMHVGHGRTYTVPDVIARFWRMRGKNVLFPMGFHVTGTPVIGISRRIAKRDEKTIRLYRDLYRVSSEELERFTDPMAIVRYFSGEYERVMRRLGLSIDWRRRFITVDPHYSRFITWQYLRLREKGRVVKGAHPVKYCPQCENPVGDHDLLEGEKAEILKFVLVMFEMDGALLPAATLRPETTYGVTNLWVNPEVAYVRARVDGAIMILSREAAEKLTYQDHRVEVIEELPPGSLLGRHVSHPLCGQVPVLPASFVDPGMGSGIVMSVPAHAPYDYAALRDLQRQGIHREIVPVTLIELEGYGRCPAEDAVERAGIRDQLDPRLDEVTQEVYSAEFASGRMLERYGGLRVKEARDQVATLMLERYGSIAMYEFDARQVICRCGGRVFVKILHDQWFLQYSDPLWKNAIYEELSGIALIPPDIRAEFERTIGWLKDWACTRRVGLGTKLPWDPSWIVEPLSDSTIYMAYYTIAHRIRRLPAEILTPEVFDYILLGIESPNLPEREALDQMRGDFLYWYPYDYRFSAKDLISNHLTFQLFHHNAILPAELQPRGIVVFGMGLLNGAKMSSSKGNVVLLEDAVDEFGPDTVRLFLVGSAEPWQDFDWRRELVSATRRQIERYHGMVSAACETDGGEVSDEWMDRWLESMLQRRIERATQALEQFQTRQALQEALHGIESDLRWYRRRTGAATGTSGGLRELASVWVRLLAPFVPFVTERLWREMGEKGLVCCARWPEKRKEKVDLRIEVAEELIIRTVGDIESILKLVRAPPRALTLYLAPAWKWDIFRRIASSGEPRAALGEVMRDQEMRKRGREAVDATKQIITHIHRLNPDLLRALLECGVDERAAFERAVPFIEREFGLEVRIEEADVEKHPKAAHALPFKPAILLL